MEIDFIYNMDCSLNISVLVLVKGNMMQSVQYNDDGKLLVEIFSISIVSLGVTAHLSAASCATAASAACPSEQCWNS